MKRFSIFVAVLLLSQLACQTLLGAPMPSPEEANMGTHRYWRETIEAGCDASEGS